MPVTSFRSLSVARLRQLLVCVLARVMQQLRLLSIRLESTRCRRQLRSLAVQCIRNPGVLQLARSMQLTVLLSVSVLWLKLPVLCSILMRLSYSGLSNLQGALLGLASGKLLSTVHSFDVRVFGVWPTFEL